MDQRADRGHRLDLAASSPVCYSTGNWLVSQLILRVVRVVRHVVERRIVAPTPQGLHNKGG